VRSEQAQSELRVFNAFASAAGLQVRAGTVRTTLPPEPDIVCELVDSGPVAFELVEILDADLARLVNDQVRLQDALRDAATGYDRLVNRFSDALIYVRFVRGTPVRQRERAIPRFLEFLGTLPENCKGDVNIPHTLELQQTVRSIRVSRGDFGPGPHFQVEAGSFIADPVLQRIAGKFAKRYQTDRPVELLAFYELHPSRPQEMWIPDVGSYISANLRSSPFSRVWIFDVDERRVLFRSDVNV
jgi:hypothetical protein